MISKNLEFKYVNGNTKKEVEPKKPKKDGNTQTKDERVPSPKWATAF